MHACTLPTPGKADPRGSSISMDAPCPSHQQLWPRCSLHTSFIDGGGGGGGGGSGGVGDGVGDRGGFRMGDAGCFSVSARGGGAIGGGGEVEGVGVDEFGGRVRGCGVEGGGGGYRLGDVEGRLNVGINAVGLRGSNGCGGGCCGGELDTKSDGGTKGSAMRFGSTS